MGKPRSRARRERLPKSSYLAGSVTPPRLNLRNLRSRKSITLRFKKISWDLGREFLPRGFSERCRLRKRPGRRLLEKPRTIGFQHDGVKREPSFPDGRIHGGDTENFDGPPEIIGKRGEAEFGADEGAWREPTVAEASARTAQ